MNSDGVVVIFGMVLLLLLYLCFRGLRLLWGQGQLGLILYLERC
jgi:hypothetical protein